jgi:hypothetical protein
MGNKNKSSSSVASNLNILKTTHTFIHLQTHCNYSTKKGSSLTRSQQNSFIQPHSPQQKKFTNLIATSKQRSVQTKQNKTKQTPQHNTTQNKTKQTFQCNDKDLCLWIQRPLARIGWGTRFGGGIGLRTAGSTEYKLTPDHV